MQVWFLLTRRRKAPPPEAGKPILPSEAAPTPTWLEVRGAASLIPVSPFRVLRSLRAAKWKAEVRCLPGPSTCLGRQPLNVAQGKE